MNRYKIDPNSLGYHRPDDDGDFVSYREAAEIIAAQQKMIDGAKMQLFDQMIRNAAQQARITELKDMAEAAIFYIESIPKSAVMPSMPGFDRDIFDEALARTDNLSALNEAKAQVLDDVYGILERYSVLELPQLKSAMDEISGMDRELRGNK